MVEIAISNVARGMDKVGPSIDKLTSSRLKKILKTITHVHIAESILKGKDVILDEEEQKLVDSIFNLQEDVMGYMQLQREINEKTNEEVPSEKELENE